MGYIFYINIQQKTIWKDDILSNFRRILAKALHTPSQSLPYWRGDRDVLNFKGKTFLARPHFTEVHDHFLDS